jgi:hypothetical protein
MLPAKRHICHITNLMHVRKVVFFVLVLGSAMNLHEDEGRRLKRVIAGKRVPRDAFTKKIAPPLFLTQT